MSGHALSHATTTLELEQVAQLNTALRAATVRAHDLGLDDEARGGGQARVTSVVASGPPTCPYLFAHLAAPGEGEQSVELHTAALRLLSRRLGLHHTWGCGSR
ncbi:MAG: hypothetical protein U0Q15_04310 [Kineosporiaceae bacterium]